MTRTAALWNAALLGASLLSCAGAFLAFDYLVSGRIVRDPDAEPLLVDEKPYSQRDGEWYELKRNFVGKDAWGTAVYDVATDGFGFRIGSRKAGRGKVIVLGDSFAYGINGPPQETFVGMLDASTSKKVLKTAGPAAGGGRSAFTRRDWRELDAKPDRLQGYAPLGMQGGLDRIADHMGKLAGLARAQGAPLFILIYPWPAQLLHPGTFSWESYVADVCRRIRCAGIIDTFPVFRAYAAASPGSYQHLYVSGDYHFNAWGNEIIFRELAAALDGARRAGRQAARRTPRAGLHGTRLAGEKAGQKNGGQGEN